MSDEQAAVEESTPGVNQVRVITHNGHEYGVRRPSSADDSAIQRRFAMKLMESPMLQALDGTRLEWKARLEVCLVPRSKALNCGERAPAFLVREVDGEPVIVWDGIDTEDFDELCRALAPVFAPKKMSPTAPSGATAGVPTSA